MSGVDDRLQCCRCGAVGHLAHACRMPLLPVSKPATPVPKPLVLMLGEDFDLHGESALYRDFHRHIMAEVRRCFYG